MKTLIFLDTETTGFNQAKIVTLAYNLGEEHMLTAGIFKPNKEIDEGAAKVHGFTNEMVANMPTFNSSLDHTRLQKHLDDRILICHNVKFDKQVLENEGLNVGKFLCTVVLARALFPNLGNHKLQTLREHFGITLPEAIAHSATGDVMILKAVFLKLLEEANKQKGENAGFDFMLSKQGYYSY